MESGVEEKQVSLQSRSLALVQRARQVAEHEDRLPLPQRRLSGPVPARGRRVAFGSQRHEPPEIVRVTDPLGRENGFQGELLTYGWV